MKNLYSLLIILSIFPIKLNAQWVTIPDANFASFLQQEYPQCMNGNQMDTTCSGIINAIKINCSSKSIATLHGIQFFDNLDTLLCNQNQLTTLPNLPNNLKFLNCTHNQLYSLPDLPSSLGTLVCGYNNLTWLPSLSANLTYLNCRDNDLLTIPTLPMNLENLECGNNDLTNLPPLPNTLKELVCFGNQLTSIPTLPNGLVELFCSDNLINTIPNLPNSLIALYAHNNEISSLPPFPSGIKSIFLFNNLLTSIPTLPDTIGYLDVRDNLDLLCLPELKYIWYYVKFTNTGIECAPNTPTFLFPGSYIEPSLDTFPICNSTFNPHNCLIFTDSYSPSFLEIDFSIFPNPANEKTTITFELKKPSVLKIEIYSITGQKLLSYYDNILSGKHEILLPITELTGGLYIVKINIDGIEIQQKLIKM